MSNQSGLQAAIRVSTSTARDYNADWLALFAKDGTGGVTYNERLLAWINAELVASHTSLPAAQQAYAVAKGFTNWSAINTATGL